MRVLLALGGNALARDDGRVRPHDQIAAAEVAMDAVAELVMRDIEVVLTHGNGPQVGNLLVKNELAAAVVPPVPLDWCGAQTQATLGMVLMNALDASLARHGVDRRCATVVTRTRVDAADPGFATPTKPIGRHLTDAEAAVLVERGETWEDRGAKGWRRVVASPEPLEILDAAAVTALVDAGFLVVATDVPAAVLRYGTAEAEPVGRVSVSEMRRLAADGHFASGSMGPKVDAVCRFVEQGGRYAVITNLQHIIDGVAGEAGTVVVPDQSAPEKPTEGESHA